MTRLPGPGWPVGQLVWGLRLLVDPFPTLQRLHRRWGSVVEVGVGRARTVFVFGAAANEAVLSSAAKDLTWREAFAALIPVDGETALIVSDGDDHARRRRLVQPAFARRRVDGCAALVHEEAAAMVAAWRPGTEIDLHHEVRRAVRRVAIRSLFGDSLAARADELGDHLQAAIDFAGRPPLPGRDLDLPGSPFRRAMRARARADAIVFEEIERRRREGGGEDDLLTALLRARDEDGSALTDQEVRDQVVSLIAGGYETTAALVAWALYAVLRDDAVLARLREDLDALPDGPIWAEALRDRRLLRATVMEALRLHGAAAVGARTTQAEVDVAGRRIPPGRLVVYSQYVTHRLEEHWPDAERFAPERWLAADGFVEPAPYTYVPFGGGARRCIGFALATLEAEVLLATVLRTVDLELLRRDIRGAGLATYAPKGGVPARVVGPRTVAPSPAAA